MLATLQHLSINRVEVALDVILNDQAAKRRLHQLFNTNFVQPWHKGKQTFEYPDGTYREIRRLPGRNYKWYCDKPDRIWNNPHCFHLEGCHQGIRAVRRLGLQNCTDLLSFDFASYWRDHLRLFEVDLDRLGRFHNNRLTGQRRRSAWQKICCTFCYNADRARGSVLFRSRAAHSMQEVRSVQQFVDCYGRGPFLVPLDVSIFIPEPFEVLPHIYA